MERYRERGYTLLEVIVVVGMLAVVLGSLGYFFLGNATPAVASAATDILAAIDEARQTANSFDSATLVFTPNGAGFTARVYERTPGDAAFRARNGLEHASNVALRETAGPLGTPGFAFGMDSHGRVTGYKNFQPADTTFSPQSCPVGRKFALNLSYDGEQRVLSVPCALSLSSVTAVVNEVATAGSSPTPQPAGSCPPTSPCTPTPIAGVSSQCPANYIADQTVRGQCTLAVCPPGSVGTPPFCNVPFPTPTPGPSSLPLTVVSIKGCGAVRTSDITSVSLQSDANGSQYVTYLDAFGAMQNHYCDGLTSTPITP